MKSIILVRGLSGSGKTTLSNLLSKGDNVYSADDYFMKDGEYKFDATKLSNAHKQCQQNVEDAMKSGIEKIFVANTFVKPWEMESYFKLASKYDYTIFTIIVENRHGNKNVHGVNDTILQRQFKNFDIKLL